MNKQKQDKFKPKNSNNKDNNKDNFPCSLLHLKRIVFLLY